MASAHRPFAALLFLLFAGHAMAQEKHDKTKIVLYKDRLAAAWDTVNCVRNVIKLNPLLFLRGEVPIYYERALSESLSAELALGITYRNYLDLSFAGEPADVFSAGTEIVAKPAYHFGLRWYLTHDIEPQGAYVQAEFAFMDRAHDIRTRDDSGRFTDIRLRDERKYSDVRAYFGYQRLAGNNNWLFDAYCGIGCRTRHIEAVEEHFDIADRHWSYTQSTRNDQVVVPFLGVKVGYGF
ncbi:MAG: hypothetical protein LKM36_01765 [Flavobacteriales bacterium]|jgi:hypothetical protein|nr:hypothetical protein [Flavobacteriales bacterium]